MGGGSGCKLRAAESERRTMQPADGGDYNAAAAAAAAAAARGKQFASFLISVAGKTSDGI